MEGDYLRRVLLELEPQPVELSWIASSPLVLLAARARRIYPFAQ